MDGAQHLIHGTGRFPLTSYGRLNSAPLFAELTRQLVAVRGRVGVIVPSGIATDSFNQYFFRSLVDQRALVSLYDFENRAKLFPAVDSRMKFCLLILTGAGAAATLGADFAFFCHDTDDLRDPERRFTLSAEDIALLNPNTRTCPIFRTRRDAEITSGIYRRVPVLVNEALGQEGNPWGFQGMLMFMMNTASEIFRTRVELEAEGWRLEGNVFVRGGDQYLPLYEAKMVQSYDHRAADVVVSATAAIRQGQPDALSLRDHADARRLPCPRYWVPRADVLARLGNHGRNGGLLAFRDVTSPTNQRTMLATLLPVCGVGHKLPLVLTSNPAAVMCLLGNLNSFAFDYVARQKLGGVSFTYFVLKQIPMLVPAHYDQPCPWSEGESVGDWVAQRTLELSYTAEDLRLFAAACGLSREPFAWDEERRFQVWCELDAAFFHLYEVQREDVTHIMEAFPIIRRKDEAAFGEYRTKRLILALYDRMASRR